VGGPLPTKAESYCEIVMEELLDNGNVLFGRKGNGKLKL
jgi:hypothetical protein